MSFPCWSQEVWGDDVACSVLITLPLYEKQARACVLVKEAMMRQEVPRCSGWASAGHPLLSPLLEVGQGRTGTLEAKTEMEGGQPANCSQTAEVAPWEKARSATLNILSPCATPSLPSPKKKKKKWPLEGEKFGGKKNGGFCK